MFSLAISYEHIVHLVTNCNPTPSLTPYSITPPTHPSVHFPITVHCPGKYLSSTYILSFCFALSPIESSQGDQCDHEFGALHWSLVCSIVGRTPTTVAAPPQESVRSQQFSWDEPLTDLWMMIDPPSHRQAHCKQSQLLWDHDYIGSATVRNNSSHS